MQANIRFESLGYILKEKGLISQEELSEALEQQKINGLPVGRILINLGYIGEQELFEVLGIQAHMELVTLEKMNIPKEVLKKIPGSIARLYNVIPIEFENNTLTVATSDPSNFSILDDLRFMLNLNIKGKVAAQSSIAAAIKNYYGKEAESVDEIFSEISQNIPDLFEEETRAENIEEMAAQLPIVKLINLILVQALKKKASDIHFEPFQDEYKIRYRLDGALYDIVNPPKALHIAIASRIKVMANLNIAENRLPQDGRIFIKTGDRTVDLRVATLPTIFGESVVIRILDKATVRLSLDDLGLEDDHKRRIRDIINKPYGIILSTGPTGCGKTTTQYSCLTEINKVEYKIVTIEDPVEFDLPGLIQVSVMPKINLTFSMALRHILRQDPDIIMVGEIRDAETVQMAIHASLTGHLVFSTLHTNDSPSAVTRLINMGVEPFLIASAIEAILAQRLVRMICLACKEEHIPSEKELKETLMSKERFKDKIFYRGKGCPECEYSGYKGRTGIFELLILDEELRTLLLEKAQVSELRKQAIKNGMRSLREDGLLKVFAGVTTLEEVINATAGYV